MVETAQDIAKARAERTRNRYMVRGLIKPNPSFKVTEVTCIRCASTFWVAAYRRDLTCAPCRRPPASRYHDQNR